MEFKVGKQQQTAEFVRRNYKALKERNVIAPGATPGKETKKNACTVA